MSSSIRIPWRAVLAGSAVVWTGLAALFAYQAYLIAGYMHQPIAWREALVGGMADMYSWALVSLALLWITSRAPRYRGALALHGLVGTAFIALRQLALIRLMGTNGTPVKIVLVQVLPSHILVLMLLLGVSYGLMASLESREREIRAAQLEAQLSHARLETLKAQLQPHFLFNTLHSISSLVHHHPDGAERMIASLSDMLRATLVNRDVHEVTLEREMELLLPYFDIQRTRFGSRLEIEVVLDPRTRDARVPHLLLQPLVENAIQHGIQPSREGGRVAVWSRMRGRQLEIGVRDTGGGFVNGAPPAARGVGLSNVRTRLRQLYGTQQEVATYNDPESGGAVVLLSIPFRRDERLESDPDAHSRAGGR